MRQYGSKKISKAERIASLRSLLIMAEDLNRVPFNSLLRSYGLGEKTTTAMLEAERARRP